EVEPVLGVVIVSAPAVPENVVSALRPGVEKGCTVGGCALHRDAQVGPPLRREVVAYGLVLSARVVGVGQVADLGRPTRLLEQLLGLGLVELGPRVGVVAKVALEALSDHAAGRLHSGGALGARDVDRLGAMAGRAERLEQTL